jgi:hypothetical protein
MNKLEVINKLKATFHWLDSNQIKLAIRQKRANPKLSWNQKPLFIGSIPIELDKQFTKNEQTQSYLEITTTYRWLDSIRITLAIRQKRTNTKLSWNQQPLFICSIPIKLG